MTVGLPLFTALDERERVALLAHELAHGANGDPLRGLLASSALGAVEELYLIVRPGHDIDEGHSYGLAALALIPAMIVMHAIARLVEWYGRLLVLLLLRESQRAEFLADALAARVAGTDAVVSLHEKLGLEGVFSGAVQQACIGRTEETAFELFRDRLRQLPERERERLRRVAALEQSRLDATHPPTGHRIRLLQEREPLPAADVDLELAARAGAELARLERAFHRGLVEDYRDRLYAR